MKHFKIDATWRSGIRVVLLLLGVTTYSAVARAQTITLGEAVDNDSLTWTTGGDADWFGQDSVYYYDGDAAQNGDLPAGWGNSSWIQTTLTTVDPILLSFYWKVAVGSSEYLYFVLDGIGQAECLAEEDWELQAYAISPGNHTLRWSVSSSNYEGKTGFLDKVVLTQGPTIMVKSPNGGEIWYPRIIYNIAWASTEELIPYVKIELYRGESLRYTYFDSTENYGYAGVFVSDTLEPGGGYRIKVTSTSDPSVYDYSDNDFSIAGLGEAVDNDSLTWTTGGDADWYAQTSVFYYDGDAARSGTKSSWIQTTLTGPGILSFHWKVSGLSAITQLTLNIDGVEVSKCWEYQTWEHKAYSIAPGDHTVRWIYEPFIASSSKAGFLDKVVFTPAPAIVVESPNGGESWQYRMPYTIWWVSTDDVGPYVKIELYRAGILRHVISATTENDGSYSWFVSAALEPGGDYRIKVTSTSNPSVYDYSDNDFSITGNPSSFGGLLVLDGEDDYADTPDHSELDVGDEPGESFTIEAKVYFRHYYGAGIIYKPDAYHLFGEYAGGRCIGFSFWSEPDTPCASIMHCTNPGPSLGWHHVALVFDKETGSTPLYLDGNLRTGFGCLTINNSDASLRLGKGWFAGALKGAIDEVRISDVVRYPSDFDPPTAPFTCDEHTRALWHFDEVEGDTVFHDLCGEDNILIGRNGAHTEGVIEGLFDIAGKVRYDITDAPVQDVTMSLSGDVTDVRITDTNGDYLFENLLSGLNCTVTPSKEDDIADFSISCFDAALIAQHAVGLIVLTPQQQKAADVDENGFIQMFDAALTCRFAVGLPPFNANDHTGEWRFEPDSLSYEPLSSDQVGQDYVATLLGDVDGNWTPASGGSAASVLAKGEGSHISLIEKSRWHKDGKQMSTLLNFDGRVSALSFELDVSYDATALRYNEAICAFDGWQVMVNSSEEGRLRLGMYSTIPLVQASEFVRITWEVLKKGERTQITLDRALVNGEVQAAVELTAELKSPLPTEYALYQNYPNPFNPETKIRFDIPRASGENVKTVLSIYNIAGQLVRVLLDEERTPGAYEVVWNARNDVGVQVPSGMYFYTLNAGGFKATKKMLVLR